MLSQQDGDRHSGLVRDTAESQLPRVIGIVGVILPATLVIQALASPQDFVQPWVPVVVWLSVLAVACWLVPRAQGGGLSPAQGWFALAVAAGAASIASWERLANSTGGTADWSLLGTICLIALVALSRPAWVWV